MDHNQQPFWETKQLSEMTQSEWESLCDGCGRCCLQKLEDEDTEEIFYTDIVCQYLEVNDDFDLNSMDEEPNTDNISRINTDQSSDHFGCRCSIYKTRHEKVPSCLWLKPAHLEELKWLPSSCAYRMLYEGKGLASWHPLLTGRAESVHEAQISVIGKVISEHCVPEEDWMDHIIEGII